MTNQQFYIFLTLIIILIIAVIIVIFFQVNTSKYIIGKKFKLKNYLESKNDSPTEEIKLIIHNPNFMDARVLGFGYTFSHHTIDYMNEYQKLNDMSKVVIASRDFINISIDKGQLIENIRYFNHGNKKISGLKMYIIDHQGETTKVNARLMIKIVNEDFKKERTEEHLAEIEIKKKEKAEKILQKKEQKIIDSKRLKEAKLLKNKTK